MRDAPSPRHVYFLGIAGAGMSALASLLKSEGAEVSGSDEDAFPPVTTYLETHGIPYRVGFDPAQMPPRIDAAIVGSSAKLGLDHNPELAELKRRGAPLYSFPAYLGEHTAGRDVAVVAGSFGKSTVTALLAHLAREAGGDPGWFVGAAPLDLPSSGHAGSDRAIFIEGDEYIVGGEDRRSKFLLYQPQALLLTSIVHDHMNVFPTMADYEAPFAELLGRLPADRLVVAAHGFEPIRRLAKGRRVVWYGVDACPGYHAANIRIGEVTRFDLVTPSSRKIPLETPMLGRHNIENIVGAAAFLLERSAIDAAALASGVSRFRGLERRLDRKTRTSRVPVYEGFGSSYEKARSAIEAVQLHFPDRRLIVVFEPHTFSWRNRDALAWYDTVFEGVDEVILLPPPVHGAASHDQLDQAAILDRIRSAGVRVQAAAADPASVLATAEAAVAEDNVVLLLSSGPLAGLPQVLPARLDARFGDPDVVMR
ncbi:MAG TPA: Mur ligase family protein [Caulobacteraceae bacterium]|jgi:UDP-N-acetylmuramate: L-alanyl-gamma-D-glutamyl-meso-diaminopimelate ligase